MMQEPDVLKVIDCLETYGIPFWIDGGWGIDALIGTQSRPHMDLDLVILDKDVSKAAKELGAFGYKHDAAVQPGLPARLVLRDGNGHEVDIHPIVIDARGHGWQPLGPESWGAYPSEGLDCTGKIAGRPVRCLSPQLQLRHHLGYSLGDSDRHDLKLLSKHFEIDLPPGF